MRLHQETDPANCGLDDKQKQNKKSFFDEDDPRCDAWNDAQHDYTNKKEWDEETKNPTGYEDKLIPDYK